MNIEKSWKIQYFERFCLISAIFKNSNICFDRIEIRLIFIFTKHLKNGAIF